MKSASGCLRRLIAGTRATCRGMCRPAGSCGFSATDSTPHSAATTVNRNGCSSCRSRSEEHTSELQSQSNLVCRLLLEKKKKTYLHFELTNTRHLMKQEC